jgi:hypothetical protein
MPDKLTLEAARRRFKEPISKPIAVIYTIISYILHSFIATANYVLSIKETFIPSAYAPSFAKTYACRPKLPMRYVTAGSI